jgi:hypothetical protein
MLLATPTCSSSRSCLWYRPCAPVVRRCPPPLQYGGFVKIRDRLSAAEEGAERVPGPRSPVPPRIYGEGVREG